MGLIALGSDGPQGQLAVPGDLGLSPWAHGVDQLSGATRILVRVPAVSNSCPGRLGTWLEGPQGRSAFPGDSGPGPRAHVVDQLPRATRAWVREPAVLTSCPG